MKIPSKIKIGGYNYSVIKSDRQRSNGSEAPASVFTRHQKIFLDIDQHPEQQFSSLLHEIIEAIDYHYELKLEHKTIMTLETALYQVLKENNLIKK